MKKIILGFTVVICSLSLFAQPTLNYNSHALKVGESNPMTYCNFKEAGADGPNQIWDYSDLEALQDFTGYVTDVENGEFALSNTELNEFGVRFYFDVNESGMYQTGYLSRNEQTSIVYSKAFEKVRFPFEYGDAYNTPFTADYLQNGELSGQIDGMADVKADAWGTVLLPENTEFKNTIRLKSAKMYTLTMDNTAREVEMITYRWYNSTHRYPLLVLTEITTKIKGDVVSKRTQAAYNTKAVDMALPVNNFSEAKDVLIYPNPSNGLAALIVNSEEANEAVISITSVSGKELISSFSYTLHAGRNEITLTEYLNGIPEGIYLVSIDVDGEIINKELSVKR